MTTLLASPLGLLIGMALGALGGGGSVLAVPVLVYVVGQSPRAAITTSLLVVGVTALGGLVSHWRAGTVRVRSGVLFGLAGVGGSVLGARLHLLLPSTALLGAFAVLMLVAAVAMLRRGRDADTRPVPDGPAPTEGGTATAVRISGGRVALRVLAAGSVVGLLTGLLGVGGGFVIVPALVLVLRFPMPVAVGTSLLVIAINAATALTAQLVGGGHVDWPVVIPFTIAAAIGVLIGSRVAQRVSADRLQQAFAVLLIVVALFVGADATGVIS